MNIIEIDDEVAMMYGASMYVWIDESILYQSQRHNMSKEQLITYFLAKPDFWLDLEQDRSKTRTNTDILRIDRYTFIKYVSLSRTNKIDSLLENKNN